MDEFLNQIWNFENVPWKHPFQNSLWSRLMKNPKECREAYMYEFETKSLLKIIFITFVIWNNCFLLQNDFFPLAHSLWQQKRCKGFSIKDSECWIFRENCKYCQKRLKCIIFHNFNSSLLPSKESRIRLLIPKCCAYNFSCFGFQSETSLNFTFHCFHWWQWIPNKWMSNQTDLNSFKPRKNFVWLLSNLNPFQCRICLVF